MLLGGGLPSGYIITPGNEINVGLTTAVASEKMPN